MLQKTILLLVMMRVDLVRIHCHQDRSSVSLKNLHHYFQYHLNQHRIHQHHLHQHHLHQYHLHQHQHRHSSSQILSTRVCLNHHIVALSHSNHHHQVSFDTPPNITMASNIVQNKTPSKERETETTIQQIQDQQGLRKNHQAVRQNHQALRR